MTPGKLSVILFCGLVLLVFLPLGIAMLCTDLGCWMFFHCKNGSIYTVNWNLRIAEDTPKNRRRISRCLGIFFLVIPCIWFLLVACLLR